MQKYIMCFIPHKGFRYAGIQKNKSIFSVCNRQKSFNLSNSHLIHVFLHLAFCCKFDRMTLTREPQTILVTEEMFLSFKSCQTFSRKRRAVEYLRRFELLEKRETPVWFLDGAESLISEKCGVNEKQEMWKLCKVNKLNDWSFQYNPAVSKRHKTHHLSRRVHTKNLSASHLWGVQYEPVIFP